jgi:hypothetical protein
MINSRSSRPESALDDSFERYLQDKGKGRGGDGGNYRRNAARELERFVEWAAGDRGIEWLDGRHRLFDSILNRFKPSTESISVLPRNIRQLKRDSQQKSGSSPQYAHHSGAAHK